MKYRDLGIACPMFVRIQFGFLLGWGILQRRGRVESSWKSSGASFKAVRAPRAENTRQGSAGLGLPHLAEDGLPALAWAGQE